MSLMNSDKCGAIQDSTNNSLIIIFKCSKNNKISDNL